MAVLKYQDPNTLEWFPLLAGTPGDTGPAGADGAVGAAGPAGPAGPSAVSVDAANIAKLGSDTLIYVPDQVVVGSAAPTNIDPLSSPLWVDEGTNPPPLVVPEEVVVSGTEPADPAVEIWVDLNGTRSAGSQTNLGTADMDTIKTAGSYYGYEQTNGAVDGISVFNVQAYSPDWIVQTQIVPGATTRMFVRSFYDGATWSVWREIL